MILGCFTAQKSLFGDLTGNAHLKISPVPPLTLRALRIYLQSDDHVLNGLQRVLYRRAIRRRPAVVSTFSIGRDDDILLL